MDENITKLCDLYNDKLAVIRELIELDEKELGLLSGADSSAYDIDAYISCKDELLERIESIELDTEALCKNIETKLGTGKLNDSSGKIRGLIQEADVTVEKLRDIEKKISESMRNSLEKMRDEVRAGRTSSKAAMNYYRIQSNSSYVEPQYMDSKK